ncbi:MAG: uncharacterized protein PWR24_1637 [Desulfonauticus sp.]|nr:MAG: hypothetical protein XD41_1412 [Desulfonauticus sp. 38_4375]MDK2922080.1 uncharacterized protein [Desulfonauticus sp.]
MEEIAFECQRCGQCCEGKGGIVVTLEEQEKIAAFLELSLEEFQHSCIHKVQDKAHLKVKNNFCLFFAPKKGCLIHPVKPKVCAAWPYFRGNLVDESAFSLAKEYCPGINPQISFAEFKKIGLYYLQKNNLICQEKDGPTALKVADLLNNEG